MTKMLYFFYLTRNSYEKYISELNFIEYLIQFFMYNFFVTTLFFWTLLISNTFSHSIDISLKEKISVLESSSIFFDTKNRTLHTLIEKTT